MILYVRADQGVKDRQNVSAVLHHAHEDVAQFRFALRFAMPLRQNQRGNLDVPPQLLSGMAAQEKPVEKCGFPLGEIEVMHDFGRRDLGQSRHREKRSLPKSFAASSSTLDFLAAT